MRFPCGEWLKRCQTAKMGSSSLLRFAKRYGKCSWHKYIRAQCCYRDFHAKTV